MSNIREEWKYPTCVILYKTDNTSGWLMAKKSGSKEECEKLCNELTKQNKFTAYKCYVDSWDRYKIEIPLCQHIPSAYDLHMRSNFIWNTDEDKFYYPEEFMPYPSTLATQFTNQFFTDAKVEPEPDDDGFLNNLDSEEDFECISGILYFNEDVKIVIEAKPVMQDIPQFLKRLKTDGYSNLCIEEFWYTKFLAWRKDDNIRFIIQNYDADKVQIIFDKLIEQDLFYNEFEKLYNILKKKLAYVDDLYNEMTEPSGRKGN
ncbi:MAG: hypothetical protein IJ529_02380 [Alphaproteobacteria bacterium]|nr:hypothetical protein [Alphaproteobacteria bacterium]MBR1600251.1 hypothetical protein [Alphaproteobacteria bacterium]